MSDPASKEGQAEARREHSDEFLADPSPSVRNVAVASALNEAVDRYGGASAEFVKGYTGVDQVTGKTLSKGLKGISESKVHPDHTYANLKQQAGTAAEVAATSSQNAEAIIAGKRTRTVRADDHRDFKKNDPVVDRVQVGPDGKVIPGTHSQMKVVGDYQGLMKKIAEGEGRGSNDLSRYQKVLVELPSEQVEAAKQFCRKKAEELQAQARELEKLGKSDLAARRRKEASNYKTLEGNIRDIGMTSDQAMFYRQHPKLATALDIGRTSHRAGVEGVKMGAVVGGAVSLVTNIIAVHRDEKTVKDAVIDTAVATGKAAAVGYGTAFAGAALTGLMQQSGSATARSLSRTSLPGLAVSICLELQDAVTRYARGEIDGTEFLELLGEKGTGMLAGGIGSMLGQVAIPVPVVGALIGGMVGCTLSSMFYRDTLKAFTEAKQARADLHRVEAACREARAVMEAQQAEFEREFSRWLKAGQAELKTCLSRLDLAVEYEQADEFAAAINDLAAWMGHSLQFANRAEFDAFMDGDETLVL